MCTAFFIAEAVDNAEAKTEKDAGQLTKDEEERVEMVVAGDQSVLKEGKPLSSYRGVDN